ncbi:MAG: DUF1853 family protein [Bacteroidetes bacterium]|nr:DUF1853 family protein [Bacteroidota bacterium]
MSALTSHKSIDEASLLNVHLRRIWWALDSPSFLSIPETAGYFHNEEHRQAIWQSLLDLDQNEAEVNSYFDSLGHMPMGRYFEQLLFFILQRDEGYDILAFNEQIVESKITLGELDLVLYNHNTKQKEHWELALKYYLQVANSGAHDNFLGPSKRDYLGRKMTKLFDRQMPLSQHPQIKQQYGPLQSKLFLKGQLFYPTSKAIVAPLQANPQMPAYEYIDLKRLSQLERSEAKHFKILKKPDWIGVNLLRSSESLLDYSELEDSLILEIQRIDRPQLLALFKEVDQGYLEYKRLFVCPDAWPLSQTTSNL